jgi:amino acid adenylation domain-containing protein
LQKGSQTMESHILNHFALRCIERDLHPALIDEQRVVTYAQLDVAADDLAVALQTAGVVPGDIVCLIGQRSVDFAVAALAVWRSGAAYVPIASGTPAMRVNSVLAQTNCVAVIALDDAAADAWFECPRQQPLLRPCWPNAGRRPSPRAPQREDLAYVIFTSGSTGEPKGVMIGHDSLADMMEAYCAHAGIVVEDRVSAVANIAFDASTIEFWPALSSGATVCVAAPDTVRSLSSLLRWMDALAITYSWLPTPLTEMLIADEHVALPRTLRMIETAGQRLNTRPRGWRVTLMNSYGPTETTVIATSSRVADADDASPQGAPDIGRPLFGVSIYVLDDEKRVVSQGEVGQLYIGGAGVGRGYWGRPDLTAQCFVPDPFSKDHSTRMYATGDLCLINTRGDLEFIGRIDDQVKLHGNRIELGEIEVLLAHADGISQVVCAVVEMHGVQRLFACYTVRAGAEVDSDALRAQLARALPDYMLPEIWVETDRLPLTENGKIDRARLPMPKDDAIVASPAGLDDAQQAFLTWYSATIGLPITWEQDFFHAGGNSIDAIRLIDALQRRHGLHLEYLDFAHDNRPSALYERLRAGNSASSVPVLIAAHADVALVPLSVAQRAIWFLTSIAPQDRAYHAKARLLFRGAVCARTMRLALQDIVDRHGIYRTSFVEEDGVAMQRVHPPFCVELQQIDLRHTLPAAASSEHVGDVLDELLLGSMNAPFYLDRLPLVRWALVCLPHGVTALLHIEHHLVHDGWSYNLFVNELLTHYARRIEDADAKPRTPMSLQYADFCLTQDAWLTTPSATASEAYWREALRGAPAAINLPNNGERGSSDGRTIRLPFQRSRWRRIETLCRVRLHVVRVRAVCVRLRAVARIW